MSSSFYKDVLDHAKKHKRKAVCLACAHRGFSPRDVEPHPCMECGELGHLRFARKTLDNYKQRGRRTQLVCTECCTRQQAIEAKLKHKKAIKCTCLGQQHSYSNEKCKLYQTKAGEKIWPGKNKEVSEDDWHFVERMRKRQKIKGSP